MVSVFVREDGISLFDDSLRKARLPEWRYPSSNEDPSIYRYTWS